MKNLILLALFLFLPLTVEAKTVTVRYTITNHAVTSAPPKKPSGDSVVYKKGFISTALAEIPNSEEWKIITKYPHKTVIAEIYKHESTFGANDACRRKDGANGFGFRESDSYIAKHGPYCYPTFESVVKDVNNWIDDKVKRGWSYARINCFYVKGLNTESCSSGYKLKSMF